MKEQLSKSEFGRLGEVVNFSERKIIFPQGYTEKNPASVLDECLGRLFPLAQRKEIITILLPYTAEERFAGFSYSFPSFLPDEKGIGHMTDKELALEAKRILIQMDEETREGLLERIDNYAKAYTELIRSGGAEKRVRQWMYDELAET